MWFLYNPVSTGSSYLPKPSCRRQSARKTNDSSYDIPSCAEQNTDWCHSSQEQPQTEMDCRFGNLWRPPLRLPPTCITDPNPLPFPSPTCLPPPSPLPPIHSPFIGATNAFSNSKPPHIMSELQHTEVGHLMEEGYLPPQCLFFTQPHC